MHNHQLLSANSKYGTVTITENDTFTIEGVVVSSVRLFKKVASKAADELFREGIRFYKIGVGLLDLSDGRMQQLDMLNENPSNDKLNAVFDSLNKNMALIQSS